MITSFRVELAANTLARYLRIAFGDHLKNIEFVNVSFEPKRERPHAAIGLRLEWNYGYKGPRSILVEGREDKIFFETLDYFTHYKPTGAPDGFIEYVNGDDPFAFSIEFRHDFMEDLILDIMWEGWLSHQVSSA